MSENEKSSPVADSSVQACAWRSGSIDKLADALAKAQAEMQPAVKDAENPFFKSSYANLEACWSACRVPLTKHGLSVTQLGCIVDGRQCLRTVLMHSSGQWVSGEYVLNPIKNDPQSMGSAVSYARRYNLKGVAGIADADDDDGEAASGRGQKTSKDSPGNAPPKSKPAAQHSPPSAPEPDTATTTPTAGDKKSEKDIAAQKLGFKTAASHVEARKLLYTVAKKSGWTEEGLLTRIQAEYHKASAKEITFTQYQELLMYLDKNKKAKS